jgi:hypothetical protein
MEMGNATPVSGSMTSEQLRALVVEARKHPKPIGLTFRDCAWYWVYENGELKAAADGKETDTPST